MSYKYFIYCLLFTFIFSCKNEVSLTKIEGSRLEINDSLITDAEIEEFIKPFRDNVNMNLDSIISYSSDTYSKTNGDLNTAIGNLMADAVLQECNPVFNSRTGKNIDVVLLNHGGIRSILSKGNVTTRTAYQIMPFENSVVVVELLGKDIKNLISYLQKAKRAHPISGLQIKLDKDYYLLEATIGNKPIEEETIYYVATNDYLYSGGDRMTFFKQSLNTHILNYKIRNVLIDYFKKSDTLSPIIDDRFTKLN